MSNAERKRAISKKKTFNRRQERARQNAILRTMPTEHEEYGFLDMQAPTSEDLKVLEQYKQQTREGLGSLGDLIK